MFISFSPHVHVTAAHVCFMFMVHVHSQFIPGSADRAEPFHPWLLDDTEGALVRSAIGSWDYWSSCLARGRHGTGVAYLVIRKHA